MQARVSAQDTPSRRYGERVGHMKTGASALSIPVASMGNFSKAVGVEAFGPKVVTELEYVIKHGGLAPKRLLRKITRRGFGASVFSGLAGAAAARLVNTSSVTAEEAAGADFTIAIIPDPQYLATTCPNDLGEYYAAMMQWIVDHKHIVFTSSPPFFDANIKAVVGVGDCVNNTADSQCKNAEDAWTILDRNAIPFITPPGNHDYARDPDSRVHLGTQFATGYFSARNRSLVYGSGIGLGGEDMAYWIGSQDSTGANTAVKFVISGIKLLILAMDFFAGNDAWSWAYDVMRANSDCECYVTTHAWLTINGTQFERADSFGPQAYKMADPPYSNSAVEAWGNIGVKTWSNLFGIFGGHDVLSGRHVRRDESIREETRPSVKPSPEWFWHQVPVQSDSSRGQTVQQLFANSQQIDELCGVSVSTANGAGQIASVFLLSRRPALGLLEGRMISTHSRDWFDSRSASFPDGTSWRASETLLFSVPFTGLQEERTADPDRPKFSPKIR
jgi:hypothetical protein